MAGGYVFQERYNVNHKTLKGLPKESESTGFIPAEASRFGGGVLSLGQTDLRELQRTYSYRTSQDGQVPDFISGQAILSYYLSRGIPSSFDTGHDFYTERSYRTFSHENAFMRSSNGQTWVRGCIISGLPPIPVIPILDVNYYGNKAISRVAPTAPNANIAQTTAEILREKGLKLPSNEYADWLKSRASLAKSAGKGYLNLSFGWIPLISDLVKIVNQLLNITEEIRRYEQLSTIQTVRRYDFLTTPTTVETDVGSGNVNVGSGSNIDNWRELYVDGIYTGQRSMSESISQSIYFKGKFQYSINPGKGLMDKLEAYEQIANKLLGTRITPAVLWELTPWSWLIDWVVDIQSAVTTAGLRSDDGLLMSYAYLMRSTQMRTSYTTSGINFVDGPKGPFTVTSHIRKKERVRGTPFGFGLNPNAFSERQWAILAALALSKSGEYRG